MLTIGSDNFVYESNRSTLGAKDIERPVRDGEQCVVPAAQPFETITAKHPGAGRKRIALPDFGQCKRRRQIRPRPTALAGKRVLDKGVMKNSGVERVGIEEQCATRSVVRLFVPIIRKYRRGEKTK